MKKTKNPRKILRGSIKPIKLLRIRPGRSTQHSRREHHYEQLYNKPGINRKQFKQHIKRVQFKLSRAYFTHPDFASLVDPLYDKS